MSSFHMSFVAQLWSWLISVGRPGRAPKDQPVQRSSDGCRWGMRPILKSRGIPNHPKPMGFNTKIVYENLELGGSPILGHLRICWAEVGDWNFHKFANILCHWNPLKYGHVWPCIQCGWYMKASASLLSPFRPGGRAFYRDAAARSRKRSPTMKRKRYEFEGKDLSCGSYLTYIYLYNLL